MVKGPLSSSRTTNPGEHRKSERAGKAPILREQM